MPAMHQINFEWPINTLLLIIVMVKQTDVTLVGKATLNRGKPEFALDIDGNRELSCVLHCFSNIMNPGSDIELGKHLELLRLIIVTAR
eukprot:scaffold38581_cov48-Attheya_sp.AAC.1